MNKRMVVLCEIMDDSRVLSLEKIDDTIMLIRKYRDLRTLILPIKPMKFSPTILEIIIFLTV